MWQPIIFFIFLPLLVCRDYQHLFICAAGEQFGLKSLINLTMSYWQEYKANLVRKSGVVGEEYKANLVRKTLFLLKCDIVTFPIKLV